MTSEKNADAGPLKVAVLGCGTVGTEVVRRLHDAGSVLAGRIGAPLELVGVAVRDVKRTRDTCVAPHLLTDDPLGLVKRDDVDLVVEVLAGTDPARSLVTTALEHGASVVSANKALVAAHGPALHETAAQHGADLFYEAAVAAAVPVLRPLRDSLCGDDVTRVVGIVNGTTNYILDRMTQTGGDFATALTEAVEQGYAEADPTADVEGTDAAAKAVILASLAFGARVPPEDVHREGITGVTAADIAHARVHDRVVKLVAFLERPAGGPELEVRVHPAMVARTHPLAGVAGADNAVLIEAGGAGPLLFRGAGAGGAPTASAILGDLVTAARRKVLGHPATALPFPAEPSALLPPHALRGRYHLAVPVDGAAVALEGIAGALRTTGITLDSLRRCRTSGRETLLLETGVAREADLLRSLDAVASLPSVTGAPRTMRILDATAS